MELFLNSGIIVPAFSSLYGFPSNELFLLKNVTGS